MKVYHSRSSNLNIKYNNKLTGDTRDKNISTNRKYFSILFENEIKTVDLTSVTRAFMGRSRLSLLCWSWEMDQMWGIEFLASAVTLSLVNWSGSSVVCVVINWSQQVAQYSPSVVAQQEVLKKCSTSHPPHHRLFSQTPSGGLLSSLSIWDKLYESHAMIIK